MKKIKIKQFPIPAWLFTVFTMVWCELLMHLWISEGIQLGRLAAVLVFGLGFGLALSQITSFIGHKKWGKWVSLVLVFLLVVFYLVEYFVCGTYQTFMDVGTLLNSAAGVASDYSEEIVGVVVRGFWRILLMLLPIFVYGIFGKPAKTSWRCRWFCLALAVAAYFGGYGLVNAVGTDASRLSTTYNFDSAIRVFGLNMGMTLELVNGGESDAAQGEFIIAEPAPTQPTEATESEETQPVEIVYEPNVMNFDFAALAETEPVGRVRSIHKYVNTVQPTMQNEFTGMFEGKNLIVITAEAFAKEVIDPELTPTLYRLANEGIRFDDYYQPMWGGSTSSGEFSVLTSLVSASGTNSIKESIQQDLFLSIGKQLQKQGYHTAAYHNHLHDYYARHLTHTSYGYDTFMGMYSGMEEGVKYRWPESDLEMMEFTVDQYIDKQPFCIYYMTVSGHCGYNFQGNAMSKKNRELVEHLDCSETLKAYYACQLELEFALQHLVQQLEEAGIADDTLIVLSTDHYPYALQQGSSWGNKDDYVGELYGYKVTDNTQRDHSGLIMWSACLEDMDLAITTPTYSLDILPTISNLFGVDYDSRLLVGRDVFSEAEPIVLWYDYTWVTERGRYISETGKFIPNEGEEVDQEYIDRISQIVYNKIYYSREVQKTEYFNYLSAELDRQAKEAAEATVPTEVTEATEVTEVTEVTETTQP